MSGICGMCGNAPCTCGSGPMRHVAVPMTRLEALEQVASAARELDACAAEFMPNDPGACAECFQRVHDSLAALDQAGPSEAGGEARGDAGAALDQEIQTAHREVERLCSLRPRSDPAELDAFIEQTRNVLRLTLQVQDHFKDKYAIGRQHYDLLRAQRDEALSRGSRMAQALREARYWRGSWERAQDACPTWMVFVPGGFLEDFPSPGTRMDLSERIRAALGEGL